MFILYSHIVKLLLAAGANVEATKNVREKTHTLRIVYSYCFHVIAYTSSIFLLV